VEFRDVKFHYPTRPDVQIYNGLNLTIKPRTTVALVGASGSGKSSVVSLLERFYDPTSGSILVDGHDISKLNIPTYRKQIAIVQQEPVLFTGTIADNIRLGKPDATDDEGIAAAKASNIHNFIETLEKKYESRLGAKGLQLSGGEKQRVAIARAIIRKPALLMLDEATSALDSKSEKDVQVALDNLSKMSTTIVIAHRLQTIRNADNIIVLERGAIIEQGKHEDLLAAKGQYATLWHLASLDSPQES